MADIGAMQKQIQSVAAMFLILVSWAVPSWAQNEREETLSVEFNANEAGNVLRLTLTEAVQAALAGHPDVVQRKIDTEISRVEVDRQRGRFDPVLSASASAGRTGNYFLEAIQNDLASNYVNTFAVEGALTGRTGIGGTYSVGATTAKTSTGPGQLTQLTPAYRSSVSVKYVQPLLRDFGRTANLGLIERAELEAKLSADGEQEELDRIILGVVQSYWTLVLRRQDVNIRSVSLQNAEELRDLVERRIRGGQAPRSDLAQADVTVAERKQAVNVAVLFVVEAERDLLDRSYLSTSKRVAWDSVLVPVDEIDDQSLSLDPEAIMATALQNRPEFRREKRAFELARINQKIAQNNRKLRLDVFAEAGLLGASGQSLLASDGSTTRPVPLIEGGFGRSYGNTFSGNAPFIQVGLQFELPLRNRDRAGAARQADLSVKRAEMENVRSRIEHDVRAALRRLSIARERLATATTAVALAGENVDAQRKRYEGGTGTLFDVLRAQDELANASSDAILAVVEQEIFLLRLDAARGTLMSQFRKEN